MGRGAFMTVNNESTKSVTLFIGGQKCMYDNGVEGSDLSYFNDMTLAPKGSANHYIESKNSSSGGDLCATDPSVFTVTIRENNVDIAQVNLQEHLGHYSGSSSNDDMVKLDCGDGGATDQDVVKITVLPA